jgi:hypothetical protein
VKRRINGEADGQVMPAVGNIVFAGVCSQSSALTRFAVTVATNVATGLVRSNSVPLSGDPEY